MRKIIKYIKMDSNIDKYMIKGISLMDVQLFVNELKSYRNDDLSKGQANSIQGANIIAKTINLADSWQNIEKDLIEFLHKLETPFLGPIKV